MRKDFTDITMVIDRSGSMSSCQADAQGGINTFIEDQKKLPGEAVLTFVQFDNVYECLYSAKPIKEVMAYALSPRGGTALLDAIGRSIVETGERLSKMKDEDKPGLVVFVIVTDGGENASVEYQKDKIKEMLDHQQDVYQWKILYIGANQDAFAEGGGMGIKTGGIANYATSNAKGAYQATSGNVGRMRNMAAAGASVADIATDFTDEEKKELAKGA